MATVEQCAAALEGLAEKLASVDEDTRKKHVLDRSLSCRVRDLDVVFTGRLGDQGLTDVTCCDGAPPTPAQIKLSVSSDDLLAICDGELGLAGAWTSGRLKIDASVFDVLRLRTLL